MEVRGWFLSVPAMVALGAAPLLLCSFSLWRQKLRGELRVADPEMGPSDPSGASTPTAGPRDDWNPC